MTQEDKLFKTIIDASIKSVVRRYPYILMGEFMGTYESTYSYLGSKIFARDIGPDDPNPVTGVRILFTLDYEQVLEWDSESFIYDTLKNRRVSFPFRYLNTLTTTEKQTELYNELKEADADILYTFYRNKYELDPDNKLGYIDFMIKYIVSDQKEYDSQMFRDDEYALPPSKFIFYKNYPRQ